MRSRIVAIVDGAGSWGSGVVAASCVANCLKAHWRVVSPRNVHAVRSDVQQCMRRIPDDVVRDEFGHEFSFVAVLLTRTSNWFIARGWYGALGVFGSLVKVYCRPEAWVEQEIAKGTLTAQQAANHKLRGVFAGELLAADKRLQFEVVNVPLRAGLVITSMELFRVLLNASKSVDISGLSAVQIHELEKSPHARNRPLICVSPAA